MWASISSYPTDIAQYVGVAIKKSPSTICIAVVCPGQKQGKKFYQ